MKEKIKTFLQSINIINNNQSKKLKYIIVVALIALLLLVVSNVFSSSKKEVEEENSLENLEEINSNTTMEKEEVKESAVGDIETSYEKDLVSMLDEIQGVSETEVMVNLDSNNIKVYEKNLIKGQQTTDETDKSGGIRKVEDQTEETQVVIVRKGEKEVPLLVQTRKPEVRGVFVVAKGVDHNTVKMWVIESVAKVLDVPTHKVSVMPKK